MFISRFEDEEVLDLFHNISETMQNSIVEIMKVTQVPKETNNALGYNPYQE